MAVYATFIPQAWSDDHLIPVDPLGDASFDVTAEIKAMGMIAARQIADYTSSSDQLRYAASAPQWVKDWPGPYSIEVEESIAEYYLAE
jgi:hypothetical protein